MLVIIYMHIKKQVSELLYYIRTRTLYVQPTEHTTKLHIYNKTSDRNPFVL